MVGYIGWTVVNPFNPFNPVSLAARTRKPLGPVAGFVSFRSGKKSVKALVGIESGTTTFLRVGGAGCESLCSASRGRVEAFGPCHAANCAMFRRSVNPAFGFSDGTKAFSPCARGTSQRFFVSFAVLDS